MHTYAPTSDNPLVRYWRHKQNKQNRPIVHRCGVSHHLHWTARERPRVKQQFTRAKVAAHNDIRHSTQLPCRYLLSHWPDGSTRCEVGPRGAFGIPIFGGRGGHSLIGGSAMVSFERAMVVSYRLSVVTIALYL